MKNEKKEMIPQFKLEAVLWDKDGVLMDTETIYFPAYRGAIKMFGGKGEYDWETHMQYAGNPSTETFIAMKEKYGLTCSREEFLPVYRQGYQDYLGEHGLDPNPGVVDLLKILRRARIKNVVATGASKKNAYATLNKTGLALFFDNVVTADDVSLGKPHPEVFIEAARRVGVPIHNCLVIEDAENGFQAARAAGVGRLVGVKDSTFKVNQDIAIPDITVNSLGELSLEMLRN